MSDHIELSQTTYSDAYYENGTLIVIKRTGGNIRHENVPQSIFDVFSRSTNTDKFYDTHIKNIYPIK